MHFTLEAQNRIQSHVRSKQLADGIWPEAICALDATAGNGFDTLFLADLVSSSGEVVAVDVQRTAIEATRRKVELSGAPGKVTYVVGSHADLDQHLHTLNLEDRYGEFPLSVAMFNLGYLPMGDKSVITRSDSTLPALEQTYRLLRRDGILSLLSYPGHAGGNEEHLAVERWIDGQGCNFVLDRFQDKSNPRSPVLWLAVKA